MWFRKGLQNMLQADYTKITFQGESIFEDFKDYSDQIRDDVHALVNYFNKVIDHVVTADIIGQARSEGSIDMEQYQYEMTRVDQARNRAHDRAISVLERMNGWCEEMHIDPICTADLRDRTAVTQFVYDACSDMFMSDMQREKDKTFDEYLYSGGKVNVRAEQISEPVYSWYFDQVKNADPMDEIEQKYVVGYSQDGSLIIDEEAMKKDPEYKGPGLEKDDMQISDDKHDHGRTSDEIRKETERDDEAR